MTRFSQDTAMGIGIVLACLMLLVRDRWFLAETTKGRRLVQWLGETWALWVLRGLLLAFAALGGLLASGMIRPIRWERTSAVSHDKDFGPCASGAASTNGEAGIYFALA